jgi:hypothetical protein
MPAESCCAQFVLSVSCAATYEILRRARYFFADCTYAVLLPFINETRRSGLFATLDALYYQLLVILVCKIRDMHAD